MSLGITAACPHGNPLSSELISPFHPIGIREKRLFLISSGHIASGMPIAEVIAAMRVGPEPDLVFDRGVVPTSEGLEAVMVPAQGDEVAVATSAALAQAVAGRNAVVDVAA